MHFNPQPRGLHCRGFFLQLRAGLVVASCTYTHIRNINSRLAVYTTVRVDYIYYTFIFPFWYRCCRIICARPPLRRGSTIIDSRRWPPDVYILYICANNPLRDVFCATIASRAQEIYTHLYILPLVARKLLLLLLLLYGGTRDFDVNIAAHYPTCASPQYFEDSPLFSREGEDVSNPLRELNKYYWGIWKFFFFVGKIYFLFTGNDEDLCVMRG